MDWVGELKNYLVVNRVLLHLKIEESTISSASSSTIVSTDEISLHHTTTTTASTSTPPSIRRAQTTNDVLVSRNKSSTISAGSANTAATSPLPPQSSSSTASSKASRRMGLIIKKSDEGGVQSKEGLLNGVNYSERVPNDGIHHASELNSSDAQLSSLPSTVPTTTISTASIPGNKSTSVKQPTSTVATPSNTSRSRSNTLREIDRMLEKTESVDTEHKSNAYFKRLSTLQEIPADEPSHHTDSQKLTLDPKQIQTARSSSNVPSPSEGSPTKSHNQHSTKIHSHPTIIKVSRKILFHSANCTRQFGDLHHFVQTRR